MATAVRPCGATVQHRSVLAGACCTVARLHPQVETPEREWRGRCVCATRLHVHFATGSYWLHSRGLPHCMHVHRNSGVPTSGPALPACAHTSSVCCCRNPSKLGGTNVRSPFTRCPSIVHIPCIHTHRIALAPTPPGPDLLPWPPRPAPTTPHHATRRHILMYNLPAHAHVSIVHSHLARTQ